MSIVCIGRPVAPHLPISQNLLLVTPSARAVGNRNLDTYLVFEFIVRWLIIGVALVAAAWIVPGIEITDERGWLAVGVTAAVMAVLNAVLKPVLVLLSCPLVLLTLGAFLLVINGFILWLAAWIAENWLDVGFEVDGYWPPFFGGIIVSIVSFLLSLIVSTDD